MSDEVFSDLPEEKKEGQQQEAVEEQKPQEQVKKEEEKPKDPADVANEKKSQAIREERARRKAAEDRANALEEENKRLKGEVVEEETEEKEQAPAPISREEIVKDVIQIQEQKQLEQEAIKTIRDIPGMTKARANELLDEWRKMPNKSQFVSVDIKFIDNRITELKRMEVGYVPNMPMGGQDIGYERRTVNGVDPSVVEYGKPFGITAEDHAKYSKKISI